MGVYRQWPVPPDGAIHLVGDTHFGSVFANPDRLDVWERDLHRRHGMIPESAVHVLVGDVTHDGLPAQDAAATAWLDAQFGAGQWLSAVGNHDLYGGRSNPDAAASAWGMPAANYVRDLGFCRVIVCAPEGLQQDLTSMQPFTQARLNWISAQLTAAGDTPCMVVCHWSLYDTVLGGAEGFDSSITTGYFAETNSAILAVLADHPNAKAWLSGHTHSPLHMPGLVTPVRVGGHTLAAVNASSPAYTGTGSGPSELCTMWVTVTAGRIGVRFRDHGGGGWRRAGPARHQVWSVNV